MITIKVLYISFITWISIMMAFLQIYLMQNRSCTKEYNVEDVHTKKINYEDLEAKITSKLEFEETQKRRIKRLRFHCYKRKAGLTGRSRKLEFGLHYSHNHHLAGCLAAKIGSTFLKQLFVSLKFSKFQSQHFGKARPKIHYFGNLLKKSDRKTAENDLIFIVSRNPYSRLYAAYIDRVFLPAVKLYSFKLARRNNKRKGMDVSFEEFLQDATADLLSGRLVDFHWQPLYNTCEPCIIPYDIIAKQESFSQDIIYILSKLNVTEEFRSLATESLHQRRTNNSIKETAKEMFPLAVDTKGLFGHTFLEFCERLWDSYKIQGYIRSSFRFPVEEFKRFSYSSLNATLDIYLHFAELSNMTDTDSKQQRLYYLSAAYKRVFKPTIRKIQSAYYLDFLLFDYDLEPP